MPKRNKIKRIANVRKLATHLANSATYFECERMTEAQFVDDLRAVRDSLTREIERKETEMVSA